VQLPRSTHLVIGCTSREDAQKVWGMLPDRLKQFGLELSPPGEEPDDRIWQKGVLICLQ